MPRNYLTVEPCSPNWVCGCGLLLLSCLCRTAPRCVCLPMLWGALHLSFLDRFLVVQHHLKCFVLDYRSRTTRACTSVIVPACRTNLSVKFERNCLRSHLLLHFIHTQKRIFFLSVKSGTLFLKPFLLKNTRVLACRAALTAFETTTLW